MIQKEEFYRYVQERLVNETDCRKGDLLSENTLEEIVNLLRDKLDEINENLYVDLEVLNDGLDELKEKFSKDLKVVEKTLKEVLGDGVEDFFEDKILKFNHRLKTIIENLWETVGHSQSEFIKNLEQAKKEFEYTIVYIKNEIYQFLSIHQEKFEPAKFTFDMLLLETQRNLNAIFDRSINEGNFLKRKLYEDEIADFVSFWNFLYTQQLPNAKLVSFGVRNFKAFGNKIQKVQLKPITLVFAPNSVGKSSFLHALIYLQYFTNAHFEKNDVSLYITKMYGDSVDLGGFESYVFGHDIDNVIEFETVFDDGRNALIEGYASSKTEAAVKYTLARLLEKVREDNSLFARVLKQNLELLTYEVENFLVSKTTQERLDEVSCRVQNNFLTAKRKKGVEEQSAAETALILKKLLLEALISSPDNSFEESLRRISLYVNKGGEIEKNILKPLPLTIHHKIEKSRHESHYMINNELFGVFTSEMIEGERDDNVSDDFSILLEESIVDTVRAGEEVPEPYYNIDKEQLKVLKKLDALVQEKLIQYIGPLRFYPDRNFILEEMSEGEVSLNAEQLWSLLKNRKRIREDLNSWLSAEDKLKTHYEIVIEEGRILFVDKRTMTKLSHRDLGLGISQLLPILIASYFGRDKMIMIEQPELHLHPAVQAEIADEFVKGYKLGNNHYVVETHSEYLLLRLMKRMRYCANDHEPREKELDLTPDDIAVLYIDADNDGTYVLEMELDEEGRLLDPWPGGFFEEGFNERFG